jgi:hypothetical protein
MNTNFRGFSSLVVLLIVAALAVGGYMVYSGKINPKDITKVETLSPVSFLNGSVDADVKLEEYEDKELGIALGLPEGWLTFRHNEGNYAYPETTLLVVHEDSKDSTQVRIKKYPLSLTETMKTTERTSPSSNPDMWNAAATTVEEGRLEGTDVVRRVQHQGKVECAAIDYFYALSQQETGVVEVSGVCASHDAGYDALKVEVAESVRFTGE